MQKLKKTGYIFLFVVTFISCGEYHTVLNKGTIEEQYKLATQLYEAETYNKAIQLFEKITPGYRGKPQMERIQFMISDSYFQTKQYSLASYYFDRFTNNYPNSSKKEEAAYLAAHSSYLDSPIFSLDQTTTNEALVSLQIFINTYPDSEFAQQASDEVIELNYKLEKKVFETAKQYHHIEDYIAAIESFDILISDYLGTPFREEAMYYKFMSSYELSDRSILLKKEERLTAAIKVYDRLKRNYPESEYLKDSEKMINKIREELAEYTLPVVTVEN